MIVAALLVIPALVLRESDFGDTATTIGAVLNAVIWAAFAVEFVTMMVVVPDRWRWIVRHPLDVLIVLFTSPFMPAAWQAARIIRLLVAAEVLRRRYLGQVSWSRLCQAAGVGYNSLPDEVQAR